MSPSPFEAPKRIFILAGESSGDLLGGRLIKEMRSKSFAPLEFYGVGGETMSDNGLRSLFPMKELSIMGFVEVLKHLPNIFKRLNQVERYIRELKPEVIITIDAPDFSFRVAKRLRDTGIPHVHYIAPSVWAWRPGRAKKVAKIVDHLLCVLPFEPPYFEKHGLDSTFVGHMVTELGIEKIPKNQFRDKHKIPADTPILCLLPGSRSSEVSRLLPTYIETIKRLTSLHPKLQVVVPLAENVAFEVKEALKDAPFPVIFTRTQDERYEAMRGANVALAASGTVNLELSMAQVPFVIGYKMSPLTAFLAPKIVRVKYMTMVNIVLDEPAIPEFFQSGCSSLNLFQALNKLLTDPEARNTQIHKQHTATDLLRPFNTYPSELAAKEILKLL